MSKFKEYLESNKQVLKKEWFNNKSDEDKDFTNFEMLMIKSFEEEEKSGNISNIKWKEIERGHEFYDTEILFVIYKIGNLDYKLSYVKNEKEYRNARDFRLKQLNPTKKKTVVVWE